MRQGQGRVQAGERTAFPDRAGHDIEVVHGDLRARRIHEVHPPAVCRPVEVVGNRQPAQDVVESGPAVANQRAGAGGAIERQAADPEPALCVAFPVVAAARKGFRLESGQDIEGAGLGIQNPQRIRRGDDERAILAERDATNRRTDLDGAIRSCRRIEAVHAAGVDVDPPENVPSLVP